MTVETLNGRKVITVYVPESSLSEKPIYFQKRGLPLGALRRIGSSNHRCSEDDLRLFYREHHTRTFDDEVFDDSSLDDIDQTAIQQYRDKRAAAYPEADELLLDDDELLRSLSCAKAINGALKPTVAGLVLFGKRRALRRCFPMMRVDYIRVPSKEWVSDPDRRFDTIEIREPLVRAIQKIHAAILDDLPKAFSLPAGELQRQEVPAIPDQVIREAIVNAVMHRSYRDHGSIQVIRYSNRLEIRNPGHSIVSDDQLGEPGSETRNPKIAAVLHDLHFAETKGTGIRVMRKMMKESDLSPPFFESDRAKNRFVVSFLFHHFLTEEDIDWLSHFQELKLTDDDNRALIFAREMGAVDNAAFRGFSHCDTLTASGRLRYLRLAGLLEMKGKGSGAYYEPTEALLSPEEKPLELTTKPSELSYDGLEPLPSALQDQVDRLSRKTGKKVMTRTILNLLSWKELGSLEISQYIERSQSYTRQVLIGDLLEEYLIDLTELKTHPGLKYKINERGIRWLEENRAKK